MRDNEPIDDIPSVAPARDEIASYNRTNASRSGKAVKAGMGGGAKFFLFLAFLLAAAALAAAGYLFQQLQQTGTALTEATERVASLEDRLSSTDESVSESTTVQGVKIKELTSEVDKLWASAWRKNQADIGKYGKQIGAQEAQLGTAVASLKSQQEGVKAMQGKLDELQTLRGQVKESQSSSIALRAQASELDEAIAGMKVQVSNMRKKVAETEEWIASFNTFRREVNSRLSSLESASRGSGL